MTDVTGADTLRAGLRQLGLGSQEGVEALFGFVSELERWNQRIGLVRASGEELVIRHILDSLSALPVISRWLEARAEAGSPLADGPPRESRILRVADLGSGGGLPGIPLACFMPSVQFILVERSGRKCGFLRNAILAARLSNVEVRNADFRSLDDAFDAVVFRALSPLTLVFVRDVLRLLAAAGALFAYKARAQTVDAEINELSRESSNESAAHSVPAPDLLVERHPLAVPFLADPRELVVICTRTQDF